MFNKLYAMIKNFLKDNIKNIIIFLVLIIVCFFEFPYVVYTPGGIVPLEKRITIEDEYDSTGSLNMSYVSMRKGNLPTLLLSLVLPNWDVVSKDEVTIDKESVDDLLRSEKIYMQSSIDNATILAYTKASKKVNINKRINTVVSIMNYAKTNVKIGDELVSVSGKTIDTIEELRKIVESKEERETIDIIVIRDGKKKKCYAEVEKTDEGLRIGIAFLNMFVYDTDPSIEVKTKSSESGSSGGLMLSLEIYNKLVPSDITHGKKVVGTGTINIDGKVGAIDGVKYKILGAVKGKADIFLCPEENYEEAMKVKKDLNIDLRIEKVATFDDALNILDSLE